MFNEFLAVANKLIGMGCIVNMVLMDNDTIMITFNDEYSEDEGYMIDDFINFIWDCRHDILVEEGYNIAYDFYEE